MPDQHCPHCQLPVAAARDPFPEQALVCPRCRLVIGPGRCKSAAEVDAEPSASGTAAGMIVNAARRSDAEAGDPDDVLEQVRAVAESEGVPVERLRMIDYDAAHRDGSASIDLAVVLRTFGSWAAVSRAALEREAATADR